MPGRQIDLAPRADVRRASPTGATRRQRASSKARTAWRRWARCARWACTSSGRAPARCIVDGVGLRGLRAPAGAARHGQRRHGDAALHGPARARSRSIRRSIGDESLMRRPMERVAEPLRADGRAHRARSDGTAAGANLRRTQPARHRLRDAGRERAGEVGDAARRRCTPRARPRCVEPAVTRDHTERMLQASACDVVARRAWSTLRPPAQSLRGGELDVPGDFSSAAFFLVAGVLGARATVR